MTTMGFLLKQKLVIKEAETKDGSSDSPRKKIRMLYLQIAFRAAKKPVLLSGKEGSIVDDLTDVDNVSPMRAITSLCADLFAAFQLSKSSSLRNSLSAADQRSGITNFEGDSTVYNHMEVSVAKIYKFII